MHNSSRVELVPELDRERPIAKIKRSISPGSRLYIISTSARESDTLTERSRCRLGERRRADGSHGGRTNKRRDRTRGVIKGCVPGWTIRYDQIRVGRHGPLLLYAESLPRLSCLSCRTVLLLHQSQFFNSKTMQYDDV